MRIGSISLSDGVNDVDSRNLHILETWFVGLYSTHLCYVYASSRSREGVLVAFKIVTSSIVLGRGNWGDLSAGTRRRYFSTP